MNLVLLTAFVWLVYAYTLRCNFVSDDLTGICEYDGKLTGKSYGEILKWLRYHICGGNFPSARLDSKGDPIPTGKTPSRHHLLSVVVYNLAILATYSFISSIYDSTFSLLVCLLFVAHPLGIQAVAWCSGIGYPLCLLWLALSLNIAIWFHTSSHSLPQTVLIYVVFGALQFLCINAMFAGMMSFVILAYLGYWWMAIFSLAIAIATCTPVIRETINNRKTQFKKQAMGESTFLNIRKIIVATKTFVYYTLLSFFPRKLGLYHTWGYHYGPYLERDDRRFYLSLLLTSLLAYVFFTTPSEEIRFGILWFTSFVWLFLNWITIQQFIAERYAFIPTLGVCIIVAYFTQGTILYWLILGISLMRTWAHLPTYDNELKFYQSNVWNFPSSEVAYGNLGVTQVRLGQIGTAMDTWGVAINLNKEYDVPHYNIASRYKANGLSLFEQGNFKDGIETLKLAASYLKKAIDCKICHFKNVWQKELDTIQYWIDDPMQLIIMEYKSNLERDKNVVREIGKTNPNNKKRMGELSAAQAQTRPRLQFWGEHIHKDLVGVTNQIAPLEAKLAATTVESEREPIIVGLKQLKDRKKLLERALIGK